MQRIALIAEVTLPIPRTAVLFFYVCRPFQFQIPKTEDTALKSKKDHLQASFFFFFFFNFADEKALISKIFKEIGRYSKYMKWKKQVIK